MKKTTYQKKCKNGHIATFDIGDYSEFCMCGEKYPPTAEQIAEEILQLFQDYADKNEDENVRVAVKIIREKLKK